MTAVDRFTPEADIVATIDEARRRRAPDELVTLLPERAPLWEGRTAAEVTRLRGWLLAAFAETGLPTTALPYALETLESGHEPYEVAGAAIAVRGGDGPGPEIVPFLLRAIRNLTGADTTLSFERYDPRWPFARPTTALVEVLRTIAGLGARASSAAAELERLIAAPDYAAGTRAEMQVALDAVRDAPGGCGCAVEQAGHPCCDGPALPAPLDEHAAGAPGRTPQVALQDQDGQPTTFAAFFCAKPSVVAFFYTRCDSPYKCSLTVTKLATLQALIRDRGLAGAVRLAAITYDPDFDHPKRLKLYASDRGLTFDDDTRCFRTTSGFAELSSHLGLGVSYGPSTVNRHQIELYLLGEGGEPAASFTRLQWEPEDALAAAERLACRRAGLAVAMEQERTLSRSVAAA